MGTSGKGRRVQALDRALAILEHLADAPTGLGLTELGRELGLPPQTAQSLVRTLQHHGWVDQDSHGTPYRLGSGPGRLHRRWVGNRDRVALARELVHGAALATRERMVLSEIREGVLAPLVEYAGDRDLQVGPQDPAPERLHLMATGRILLASLAVTARECVLDRCRFDVCAGPRAPRDRAAIGRKLTAVARTRRAVCRDENGAGISALAVPVVAGDGTWIAALGLFLPTVRLTKERREALFWILEDTAPRITEAWGEG